MLLTLWMRHRRYTLRERITVRPLNGFWIDGDLLAASDLQFGRRHFATPEPQKRWFARFKRWMARNAVTLEAQGGYREKFYVFPAALDLLKRGVPYYARGLPIDTATATSGPPDRTA